MTMIGPLSDTKKQFCCQQLPKYGEFDISIYIPLSNLKLGFRHWRFGIIRSRQDLNLSRRKKCFALVAPFFIALIVFLSFKAAILLP